MSSRSRESGARVKHRSAAVLALAGGMGIAAAGCEDPNRKMTLEEQFAHQVAAVESLATEAKAQAQADHQEQTKRIDELAAELAAQAQRHAELATRLQTAETALAGYGQLGLEQAVQDLQTARADLVRLDDELRSHVAEIGKSLEASARERRMLTGADAELRGYVDSITRNLESKSTQARDVLRTQLIDRLDKESSMIGLSVRKLENQVEAGAARIALAVQLLRESLQMEQRAIAGRQQRIREVLAGLDQPVTTRGGGNPDEMASLYFKDAMALHEAYLADSSNTQQLEDALLNYRKGLALRPDDAEMHYQLSRLLLAVDRKAEAEPHLHYYLKKGTEVQHLDDVRQWLGQE
ncbi:MAG: hypothetical protein JSV19_00950 [Phycisphaerales bacterium]|nr:MAG: hypothetical protein JSV19_00950 [Phycisphaerales bacterium]